MFKKLYELHKEVIKFIITRVKNKQFKGSFRIFINLFKSYFKAVYQIFSEAVMYIFDKKLREKLNRAKRYEKAQAELIKGFKVLKHIDKVLDERGYDRTQKRIFWREFAKDGKVRTQILESMFQDYFGRNL